MPLRVIRDSTKRSLPQRRPGRKAADLKNRSALPCLRWLRLSRSEAVEFHFHLLVQAVVVLF